MLLSLLIPTLMLAGVPLLRWVSRAPDMRFSSVGFRTELSESSEKNWYEANSYAARIWLPCSLVLLVISLLISTLILWRLAPTTAVIASLVVMSADLLVLVATVIMVQIHLEHSEDR